MERSTPAPVISVAAIVPISIVERSGWIFTVFVTFKVAYHTREHAYAFQQALKALPEVVGCYMISGNSDFWSKWWSKTSRLTSRC